MRQATHYRLNQDFMMFISHDHVLFRFKVHWTFIARYNFLILIPNGYFDPSFCFPLNYLFSQGKLVGKILFDDDDDDVEQEEREEDKVREKEEEMTRKSNFSQNNLLRCLITICVRRCYNLRIQNAAAFITKCVGWIYYKMLHPLLHNAHIIIKCRNRYYKMRNVLQSASLLQNAAPLSALFGGICVWNLRLKALVKRRMIVHDS